MTNPLLRGLVDLLRPSVQRPCVLTASRRTVIMPADLPTLQRSPMPRQRLSSTALMEHWAGIARSLCPDARELDHAAPLLNLGCHMVAELRGSEDFWRSGDLRQPRLDGRVHQAGIDLAVEALDDLGWRTPWHADPSPYARLVAWHGVADGRDIRQLIEPSLARHGQRTQRARSDVGKRGGQNVETDLHLSTEQINDHRRRAAIGHVNQIDAGHHLEQLARHM